MITYLFPRYSCWLALLLSLISSDLRAENRFCQYGLICLSTIQRDIAPGQYQLDLWLETYQSMPLWVRIGPPQSGSGRREYYERGQKTPPSQIIWKRITAPGRRKMVSLTLANQPRQDWRFSFHPYIARSRHNPKTLYRLPYRSGESYPISQGYHGDFSHQAPSQFSLDFAMPSGTAIVAARDGVILGFREKWYPANSVNAGKGKGNFIWIQHADGSMATYAHLKQNWRQSPLLTQPIQKGKRVKAGDVIAVSGNTGYSTGPHLHFQVSTMERQGNYALRTHKTYFDLGRRQPVLLKQGFAYQAP